MELTLNTNLPVVFEKLNDLEDSRFTRVKIWLMHMGKNLNNSIFTKSVVENALGSLSNIPILGYVTVDSLNEKDFKGHEQRIVMDENGVSVEYLGRIYGVIPETNNATFEMKTVDGIEREYLVCEGILYNQFPESVEILTNNGSVGQSMELDSSSIKGSFNKQKVFEFQEFKFSGACLLGQNVPPAMVGSTVEKFSTNSMQEQLSEILTEFNTYYKQFSLNNGEQGGEQMDKKKELLVQFSQLDEISLEYMKQHMESYSDEAFEQHLFQMSEAEAPVVEVEPVTEFTFAQVQRQITMALRSQTVKDRWGDDVSAFWYVDHDENRVFAQDAADGSLVGLNYALNGDFVVVDFASKKKVKMQFVDMVEGDSPAEFTITTIELKDYEIAKATEVAVKEVEDKFSTEKADIEKVQEELTSLREFKNNSLKDEKLKLIENFSDLNDEVLKDYIENVDKFSKEELETKLFAEVGKANLSFSKNKKQKKNDENLVVFTNLETNSTSDTPEWMQLVEQYKSKKQ
jgi:hypothetical protein